MDENDLQAEVEQLRTQLTVAEADVAMLLGLLAQHDVPLPDPFSHERSTTLV